MSVGKSWQQPGCRVVISSMEHSPMTTRAFGSLITGRTGEVVSVMRHGRLAFVKLDGPQQDLPNGMRRWMMHWDDLTEVPR
ncbi:hypothetical protein [Nonomuraea guangzhouensis]|uniref:DUF1918 domain-containing protein n=1 Tax=Nonomuraea guangzhouensis TaxID=1291555 RepID=A0ABW4GN03_9ACTN|nr:hypothetical protein [Nonomuraea guangzhouensis]